MTARLTERLASEGHPWPDFAAAAVLAERGRRGLGRKAFAEALAVSEEMLAGVEDGLVDHDIGVGHGMRRRTLKVEV
jgi:hypothetical protein